MGAGKLSVSVALNKAQSSLLGLLNCYVSKEKHMNFSKIQHYIKEIAKHEFADRDLELQKVVTKIKQEMNARNLLLSSITIQKLTEFLSEEFKCRCTYIKDLLIDSIDKLSHKEINDPIGKVKTLYQEISFSEKDKITAFYKQHCGDICESLSNKNMIKQLEDLMGDVAERSLQKNNLILHFEYDSVISKKTKTPIIFIKPSFMGASIDVMALWERYFKN